MPRGDKASFHKSDMFLERSPTGKGEPGILASGRRKNFVERKTARKKIGIHYLISFVPLPQKTKKSGKIGERKILEK